MPQNLTLNLVPILPLWAIVALAAGLALLLVHGSILLLRKRVPGKSVALLGALRVAIILVFAAALLQPVISFTRKVEEKPDLLVMIDTSQSMGGTDGAAGATRLERSVDAVRGRLAGSLSGRFNVRYFAFDRSAYPLEESDLAGLKPTGDATRFSESLAAAWDYQRQSGSAIRGGQPPARALLVSDGNDLSAEDIVETARKLGVTVDALPPAGAEAGRGGDRVAIASVQSPRRVFLGSEMQLQAALRTEGATEPVTLTLSEGDKALTTLDVAFNAGQTEKQITIPHRPSEVGVREYELRLTPKGATEPTQTYRFSVRVADNQNEVLVLADTWRWDFKFLRRVFEDDPTFNFTAFLSKGSGSFAHLGEADRKVSLAGFPQSKGELEWFDTIILADASPKKWSKSLAATIAQLVVEEGKSLIVMAGPNIADIANVPEIAYLLPVELTDQSAGPIEGPIDVRVSPEGSASAFLYGMPATALPPVDQVFPPLKKRPAATILLEAAKKGNAFGPLIVMAEHTVGRGRVLYVGSDTLWKWQMTGPQTESGVTPYAIFWQQTLRALAPVSSHTGGVLLAVQPERSRYESGRRVVLRAQVKSDRPLPAPTLAGSVTLPGGGDKVVPLAFSPDPKAAGFYTAEFEAGAAGQYKIATVLNSEGKSAAETLTAIDVEQPRAEAAGTRVDAANLARIASATGGKVIDPDDKSTWPDAAAAPQRYTVEERTNLDLWNNYALMIVLCALLGADWLLRLVRGYV